MRKVLYHTYYRLAAASLAYQPVALVVSMPRVMSALLPAEHDRRKDTHAGIPESRMPEGYCVAVAGTFVWLNTRPGI